MRRFQGTVSSITLEPTGHPSMEIHCPTHKIPRAGQIVLALANHEEAPLRQELHPVQLLENGFRVDPACGTPWNPGTSLDLLGPIGSAINPPADRQKWLLISMGASLNRLLPLVHDGLTRAMDLSCWSDIDLPPLPPGVEFEPELENVLPWADYLVVVVAPDQLDTLMNKLQVMRTFTHPLPGKLIVDLPLTCGMGLCHNCQVSTRNGTRLVCSNGPVFDLTEFI